MGIIYSIFIGLTDFYLRLLRELVLKRHELEHTWEKSWEEIATSESVPNFEFTLHYFSSSISSCHPQFTSIPRKPIHLQVTTWTELPWSKQTMLTVRNDWFHTCIKEQYSVPRFDARATVYVNINQVIYHQSPCEI